MQTVNEQNANLFKMYKVWCKHRTNLPQTVCKLEWTRCKPVPKIWYIFANLLQTVCKPHIPPPHPHCAYAFSCACVGLPFDRVGHSRLNTRGRSPWWQRRRFCRSRKNRNCTTTRGSSNHEKGLAGGRSARASWRFCCSSSWCWLDLPPRRFCLYNFAAVPFPRCLSLSEKNMVLALKWPR